MSQRIAVLLIFGSMPWAGLHAEQPASATFKVSARVEAVCEVTATGVNSGRPLTGSALLRATCTPDSSYKIGLNRPSRDSQEAVWGNTTGTDTVTGVGTGFSQDHTVGGGDSGTVSVRIYY